MKQDIAIDTPFIRLDAFLKLCRVVESGGRAKVLIQSGGVLLNGAVCLMRGKKLVAGDCVQLCGEEDIYCVTQTD